MVNQKRGILLLLLSMTLLAGCTGLVPGQNSEAPYLRVHNLLNERVEISVTVTALSSPENNLNRNVTLINQTVRLEAGASRVLQENPFENNGTLYISARSDRGHSASRTLQERHRSGASVYEIDISADKIEINGVIHD